MQLVPGSMIAGRFRLERPLAKGGMGEVWVANDVSLDVPVALKFMSQAALGSEELVARFEMEAKAAAKLRHPHVVQILAHGVDRGTPFIAMELLEGEDLGARLKARGRLPLATIARIVRDVCKPLQKAHANKLVHRDLKPANIFLCKHDDYEIVKVLDFGIAKSVAEATAAVTKSGAIIGSPHYMSPEQARRTTEKVDHRSDLWALGVIVFRALTGQLPFPGTNMFTVIMSVMQDPVPRASSIAPDVGAGVDSFLAKALARDPEGRFQSAREMGDAIAALAGLPIEEGQTSLHRSWSDEAAPSPRVLDRPAPRIPPPRASDPGTVGRSRFGAKVEPVEESAFDDAKTVPLASSGAQRAIAGKPWAAATPAPPRAIESTIVDSAPPPDRGGGLDEPRVIVATSPRPPAASDRRGASPADGRGGAPLPSVPEIIVRTSPADGGAGAMGTLTSSGTELPVAQVGSPRRDKPWVILIIAGAAVVVVLVVIGAVLTTAESAGAGSGDEAAPVLLGTSAATSTLAVSGGSATPGLVAPVSVSADRLPEAAPSASGSAKSGAPAGSGAVPGKGAPAGTAGAGAVPRTSASGTR